MAKLHVEVIYALPGAVDRIRLVLDDGATALDAWIASGLAERHAELRPSIPSLGVFGRVVRPEQALADGDRVEVYRPLLAEPKEARRLRTRKKG